MNVAVIGYGFVVKECDFKLRPSNSDDLSAWDAFYEWQDNLDGSFYWHDFNNEDHSGFFGLVCNYVDTYFDQYQLLNRTKEVSAKEAQELVNEFTKYFPAGSSITGFQPQFFLFAYSDD